MSTHGRSKKILFRSGIVLATLVACELAARVFFAFMVGPRVLAYGTGLYRDATDLPSVLMQKAGYTPPTPESPQGAYLKFAPNEIKFDRDEHGDRFSPTINSRGFRGEEFSEDKKPGVVRIVTLGASSTFGYRDRDDETFPFYLEQVLNSASPGEIEFEVINLGIPHIASDLILPLFLAEALPLNPDVVTLYAGWNDSGGVRLVTKETDQRPVVYDFFRRHVLLVAFADSLAFFRLRRFSEEHLEVLRSGKVEQFLGNISRVDQECRQRGILFLVATQQAKSTTIDQEEIKGITYESEVEKVSEQLAEEGVPRRALVFLMHAELMSALEEWAPRNGVALVDVREKLNQDRDVLLSYIHLNPRGNRMIAEAFAEEILHRLSVESLAPATSDR